MFSLARKCPTPGARDFVDSERIDFVDSDSGARDFVDFSLKNVLSWGSTI